MSTVIQIENLSKKYIINHCQASYSTLRETISNKAKSCWKHLSGTSTHLEKEEFWALKNISLRIEEGDRIGILGKNGAGKSTLLKLISRITKPTTGKIKIFGRVSSLLEVGTGFHPELTGKENIFLNGAILGMSWQEIKKKFDEIVAFAEIEKFLDMPIKRYSSGMNARLGFAIAAHLDADLIILDEVLAVGDLKFQEKCLKKVNEIGAKGRTVLFVSHTVSAVMSLCNKGIFLEKGQLISYEPIEQCVARYVNSCPMASLKWQGNEGDEHIRVQQISIRSPDSKGFFFQGEETVLDVDYEILQPRQDLVIGFSVFNMHNQLLARSHLSDLEEHVRIVTKPGKGRVSFLLDMGLFHVGEYILRLECSLFHKKPFIQDQINLKFSVYPREKMNGMESISKEGISLGNRWLVDLPAC